MMCDSNNLYYRETDDGDSWHDLANPYETDIADSEDISEVVRESDEQREIRQQSHFWQNDPKVHNLP